MGNGDETRLVEQEGIGVFTQLSAKFGGLVRLTDTHDKGIDAELEVINSFSIGNKTPILGVQVKSRTDAKQLKNGDFSIRVTQQNIEYWSKYGRPVLLVLYDKSSEQMYWQRVEDFSKRQIHVYRENVYTQSSVYKFVEFCSNYSITLIKQGDLIDCEPLLADIAKTYGELSQPIMERLGKYYDCFREGDYSEAARLISPLVEIYSNSKYLLANAALTLSQLGDRVAINYVNQLIKIGRLNAQEQSAAATVLSEFGMYNDAIPHFEASLKLKDSRNTKNNYALTCLHLGLLDKSEELFSELLCDGQQDEKVTFNHALLMTKMGKYEEAINSYNKSIDASPSLADAYNNLALLYKALGFHEQALAVFQLGVYQCKESFNLYYNYASLLKDYAQNEYALNLLLKAVSVRDESAAWRDIAIIYCRIGELKTAEELLTEHIEVVLPCSSETKNNEKNVILDVGFECQYVIRFRFISERVVDIEVEDCSSHSLFNECRKESEKSGVPFETLKQALLCSDRQNQLDKLMGGTNRDL